MADAVRAIREDRDEVDLPYASGAIQVHVWYPIFLVSAIFFRIVLGALLSLFVLYGNICQASILPPPEINRIDFVIGRTTP